MGTGWALSLRIWVPLVLAMLMPLSALGQNTSMLESINKTERSALVPAPELLDKGAAVADASCSGCHGLDGLSRTPGTPHLAGQRMVYLFRTLQAMADHGRQEKEMTHAVDTLNSNTLLALAAHYANLPTARPANVVPDAESHEFDDDPFVSIRKDLDKCGRCHGQDGNASASGMPNLTAQPVTYFITSMLAYGDGSRDHRMMQKLTAGLDRQTLELMGIFYATQEPVRTNSAGDGDAERGRGLAAACTVCHGEDGNTAGEGMPTLAGQDARYFIKAMKAYQAGGRQDQSMREALEPLSDDDLTDLAAFYAAQEPIRRNVRAPLTTVEWIDRCTRCHGIDGNSTDPRFPMLAGQDRTYLSNALAAYRDESRVSTAMHAMATPLSGEDLNRIAAYYSSREPRGVVYFPLPCDEGSDP